MWANKYIGIPFKANGRDESGLDCWGLVRLVYKQEYNIELPSFAESYEITDTGRIQELLTRYKEGWTNCSAPEPGSVILFRIMGEEQHVGISIDAYHFLHVREGSDSAIEKLSNPKWSKRVAGYFKYTSGTTDIVLNAVPHPLKTEKITLPVPAGTSITQIYNWLQKEYTTAPELVKNVHIILNGKIVPKESWDSVVVQDGDALEYRAVAGRDAVRLVLTLAVMYVAFTTGTFLMDTGTMFGGALFTSGTAAATLGNAVVAAAASAAITNVGMRLIDKIAPIRGADVKDPGNPKAQYLFSGGSNQANRYGAIPVILGKVRMTPPLGANTFVDYEQRSTSYLNTVLVWGYGPLKFYEDTLRIGNKNISSFYEVSRETITGYPINPSTPEEEQELADSIERFSKLYPQDLEQVFLGPELAWKGSPDPKTIGATVDPITGEYNEDDVDADKQPDYFYDAQGTNYLELGLGTVNPNAPRIFEIPQAVADQRQNLIVTYYWGNDGMDGSQGA